MPRGQNALISTNERSTHSIRRRSSQSASYSKPLTELWISSMSLRHLATIFSFVQLCIHWRWGEESGISKIPHQPSTYVTHTFPFSLYSKSLSIPSGHGVAWEGVILHFMRGDHHGSCFGWVTWMDGWDLLRVVQYYHTVEMAMSSSCDDFPPFCLQLSSSD